MKTRLFILILLFGATLQSAAQIKFQTTLKKDGGGNGFAVQQTTDGGYIWGGYTVDVFSISSGFFLIKTNAFGDTLWTKSYGGSMQDLGWSVQQTSDGGYVMTGLTQSFGAGGEDVYLIKTDSLGDLIWSKTIGGSNNDRANCVRQTYDGGYILTGVTESFGAGDSDIYVVKTDPNGDTLWTKTYGGASPDAGTYIQQTADDGYIITGITNSFGTGNGDLFLIKTDQNGDPLWQKAYGEIGYDYGYSVQELADGAYIVAGYTSSFGAGSEDFYLIKTDSTGNLMWSKTFGEIGIDRARCAQQTADGGYAIAGFSYSFSTWGDGDAYLIKTDANGDAVWSTRFGGDSEDQIRSVYQTSDGGYVVTGGTLSFGTGTYDIYLIKTDAGGTSECNLKTPPVIENVPPTIAMSISTIVNSNSALVTDPATVTVSGAEVIIACSEVGINETSGIHSLNIFPNPSLGNFTLSTGENFSNATVEVVNIFGEKIFSENLSNTSEHTINLENITAGIYFVKIFDGQKSVSEKVIVE